MKRELGTNRGFGVMGRARRCRRNLGASIKNFGGCAHDIATGTPKYHPPATIKRDFQRCYKIKSLKGNGGLVAGAKDLF